MSSPRRIGLPETLRMRHDTHYVDQLGRPGGAPVGRMVPIEDIDPNPNQPRQVVGDLSELVASVREKGVLEPILVRPRGSRFQIIAGERRFRAAIEVGLAEIPCVVRDTSDAEMMEIALVENLQRKDLTAFEEADGLRTLADNYGYTHEAMAEKLGKSRTSITEIALAHRDAGGRPRAYVGWPTFTRSRCCCRSFGSRRRRRWRSFIERLKQEGGTRDQARRIAKESKPKSGGRRARPFVFRYQPREKTFSLDLRFRKSDVPREDIVRALQSIIDELTRDDERVSARG